MNKLSGLVVQQHIQNNTYHWFVKCFHVSLFSLTRRRQLVEPAIVNTATAAKTGPIITAKFNLSVGRVMLPATKMKMKTEH